MVVKATTLWPLAAGKVAKAKNALGFSGSSRNAWGFPIFAFQTKTHGQFDILEILEQSPWARCNSSQNSWRV